MVKDAVIVEGEKAALSNLLLLRSVIAGAKLDGLKAILVLNSDLSVRCDIIFSLEGTTPPSPAI